MSDAMIYLAVVVLIVAMWLLFQWMAFLIGPGKWDAKLLQNPEDPSEPATQAPTEDDPERNIPFLRDKEPANAD